MAGCTLSNFPRIRSAIRRRARTAPERGTIRVRRSPTGSPSRSRRPYGFTASGFTIDFSPALRFNPNTKVLIATNVYANAITSHADYYAANPSALHYLGIYYRPQLNGTAQTDAGSDASLVTHVNLNTGIVWRRIKHFSGYNMFTGLPCDPSPDDPDCIDDGGPDVDGGHGCRLR